MEKCENSHCGNPAEFIGNMDNKLCQECMEFEIDAKFAEYKESEIAKHGRLRWRAMDGDTSVRQGFAFGYASAKGWLHNEN